MKRFSDIAQAARYQLQAPLTDRERALLTVLRDIVLETMAYPPRPPIDTDSYLPQQLVDAGHSALLGYGCHIVSAFNAPASEQTEREALDQAISGLVGLSAS